MAIEAIDVQEFLTRSMNMRVATLSAKGLPHLTPLRFICADGKMYTFTRAASPAARHIAAHPKVVLLFDRDETRPPGRVLRIRAHAAIRNDPQLTRLYKRRAAAKYFLRPGGIWNLFTHVSRLPVWVRGVRNSTPINSALIEFVPDAVDFLLTPA